MPVMLLKVLALVGLVTVITVIIQCSGLDYGSDNYHPYFPSPPTMATTLECSLSIIGGQVLQANQPNPLTSSNLHKHRKLRTHPNQFNYSG